MAKILVTGANGQLGSELRELASSFPQHQFLFCTREEMDITDEQSIQTVWASFQPQYCINCAAYTAVDKAETEVEAAFAGNATAVKNIAAACAAGGTRLIHISTDYVFDGAGTQPYEEDHPTGPINVYGQSKLKGEQEALAANPDVLIIRTSWVYSAYGNNFVKTMIRVMQSRPEVRVVADQQGCPTYAADLAQAILQIVDSGKWQSGIYHYSNAGVTTWFDFAHYIKELIQADCSVQAIPTKAYPTPAKRPAYSVMDTRKISQTFNIVPKPWKESLQVCIEKLKAKV